MVALYRLVIQRINKDLFINKTRCSLPWANFVCGTQYKVCW